MISIVLTYRNRDLTLVKKCLDSLNNQTDKSFIVYVVDYGSNKYFSLRLKDLVKNYSFIELIYVLTQGQLWNKSKAINIALKQCKTTYFFVGDIDMIFRVNFIEKLRHLKKEEEVTYFQVGFLSKEESKQTKEFKDYKVQHISANEATGMTLYPTKLLNQINGFDEFYHGWGSEDTDVHIRLQNAGYKINFYTQSMLLLHQWHPKIYRSKDSNEPFHTSLEQINQQYLQQVIGSMRMNANENFGWGKQLNSVDFDKGDVISLALTNLKSAIDALLLGTLNNYKQQKLIIKIKRHIEYKSAKNNLKRVAGKKYFKHYHFQEVNNLILATIIANFRNNYYEYEWSKELQTIILKIAL